MATNREEFYDNRLNDSILNLGRRKRSQSAPRNRISWESSATENFGEPKRDVLKKRYKLENVRS